MVSVNMKSGIMNMVFHILKTLSHPSTINHKSRLVNLRGINVFYFLLKMRVKMVSVNMKNGIVAIFLIKNALGKLI